MGGFIKATKEGKDLQFSISSSEDIADIKIVSSDQLDVVKSKRDNIIYLVQEEEQ